MVNYSKFGASDWDQDLGGKAKSAGKKDVYMRLQPGSNPVRVLTPPFQYLAHKYKTDEKDVMGDKVMCSYPLHKACPLCDLKDRAKPRWFVMVIDRKTNESKLLDIGAGIYGKIKQLNDSEKWGNPLHYDLDITVNKNAPPANYHGVVPDPKTPLSESDLKMKNEVDMEHIASKCTPPTPEWVKTRVNAIRTKKGLSPLDFSSVTPVSTPSVDMSEDEEDLTFPAVTE